MRRILSLLSVGVMLIAVTIAIFSIIWRSSSAGNLKPVSERSNGCSSTSDATTPTDVVCDFYDLASKGDIGGALELQTSEMPMADQPLGTNRIVPANSFNDSTWALQVKNGLDRLIKIRSEKHNDRYAVVVADTLERNGTKAAVTQYNLHHIRGKWKIYAVFDYSICEGNVDICHPIESPPN